MLTAASNADYKVGPAPYPLLPGRTPAGEQLARPGDVVALSLLGRAETALLVDPIELDRLGQKRSFPKETIFESASVPGVPGDPPVLFCEPEQPPSFTKAMVGSMGFGMVGVLRPTRLVTRYCLYDADHDEKLDHAILIGAKGESGHAPFEIPPARYGLITGLLLGNGSELRLRYAGPAGEKGSVSFDTEVTVLGMTRPLPGSRHSIPITKLPAYAVIEGAVVTVLDYEPETRVARVRIDRDLAPGHFVVPEQPR
ncbi:MAG: hypothetical protein V4472_23635 [Pseudomonadota bacterium]